MPVFILSHHDRGEEQRATGPLTVVGASDMIDRIARRKDCVAAYAYHCNAEGESQGEPFITYRRKPDPREADNTRSGIFVHHNCSRCGNGARPCAQGSPNRCEFPHARND